MPNLTKEQVLLSESFTPGMNDVILGRGRKCYAHAGNLKLVDIVQSKLNAYSEAESKKSKSEIIFSIVVQIREHSPEGGFVKHDEATGRYYEVGNHLAREKVSQAFRDALSMKYKSSTPAKSYKRKRDRFYKRNFYNAGNGRWSPRQPFALNVKSKPICLENNGNCYTSSIDPVVWDMPSLYQDFPFPTYMNHRSIFLLSPSKYW